MRRGRRLAALRAGAERASTEGERAAARKALASEEERVEADEIAVRGPAADVEVGADEPGVWEARDRDGRGTRYQVKVASVEIARDWFLRGAMLRKDLPGTVVFIFQPAEEGAPEGEEGGAELMLAEGVFADPKPDAVMGLHVGSNLPAGVIGYREGPMMAAVDSFDIVVKGRQTHGSRPWQGVDPITAAAQIIGGMNTIVSRQVDITSAPAVVSFGAIKGGIRENIIPDDVHMIGTIRNFSAENRALIFERIKLTGESIASSQGATATVRIDEGYPVTANDPALTARMLPTLQRVAGPGKLVRTPLITGAEDFSFFAEEVPGLYIFIGVTDPAIDPAKAPTNHSPLFRIDERGLPVALRAMLNLAVDFLDPPQTTP